MDHLSENWKLIFDGASLATALGALSAMLPPLAALVSLVWSGIRIYESKTVQTWLKRRPRK